ncbi:hypothetical protein NA56DRAFT_197221 [Hyaloscypha hepaticicola]|uniref:Uncharacterized protein n=1 Tax=Hyaloscypha hepaticicola TaxID=2082293 RepID=A0A2J6Q067_9HELO|nr:hypothetical protein NA56DRAFT_197221 [Hyaloscypha hepaticicola]
MDATTRPDLVVVSLPLEVVVPRSVEERTVLMTTQGKPRAGTSGSRENVQIFDYIPRAGEDGQFKLFNYRHLASEIASETPRTLLDIVSDEEDEFDNYTFSSKPFSPLEALILEPSNERQELENHERSSKGPPVMNIMEQTNVSVLSKGNASDHNPSTGSENHTGGSNASCKVLHDQAVDGIITANPTFLAAGSGILSPSRFQLGSSKHYGSHSEGPCGVVNSASKKEHIMEELPSSLRKNGENHEEYNMSRSCLDGSLASTETPKTQPTSVAIPRKHIITEKAGSPRSLPNASVSTEHGENIQEVRSESDSCSFPLGDTAGKQKSVYPNFSPGHTVVKMSASHEVEAESLRREAPKSTSFSNPRRAKTLSGKGKVGEFHEESFIFALDELHISSTVSTQALILGNKALATKVKSEVKKAASVDFDHASHSTFGIGSWIENEPRHLRSSDIDGPHEVCLRQTNFGMLEDLFAPGWHAAFRACPGYPASGSGSQRGNSFEAGSPGSRQSPPNGGNSHRKHPSDGGDGPGEEDDPVQSKKAKTENETNRRLICPFNVHDPTYFRTSIENGQKYITCAAGKGFPDIPRLK